MKKIVAVCLFLGAGFISLASPIDTETVARLEQEGRYRDILALCEQSDESAESLCIQGDYYIHGRKDVPMNKNRGRAHYRRALELLSAAAETGDAVAQYRLALCHEYGIADMQVAREWYLKAADAGSAKAMFKAAWFAARRIGADGMTIKEARDLSLRYAKAASESGNPDGTALLAWLTHLDCGDGRDFAKARPFIVESVKEDSPLGKTLLGRMYMEGRGGEQDMAKAEQLLQEAVDQGYAEALSTLKEIKMERVQIADDEDDEIDDNHESLEAVSDISTPETKAKHGAELYERRETREKGLELLREAADEGSPFAMARLSALYYLGEGGVERDFGMALKLMQAAVAKGFPKNKLPLAEAQAAYDRAQAAKQKDDTGVGAAKPAHAIALGDGYPGRLAPYKVTPELQGHLDRFNLTAGWFYREPVDMPAIPRGRGELLANELPYLLFAPKRKQLEQQPVPLIIYFGGTGEHGTNLVAQFNHSTLFAMISAPEFQQKRPCYLFAPMVPHKTSLRGYRAKGTSMSDLVCDALYAIIREAQTPPVDTNRLYLTGLSYGGSAAYTFPFGYPGRFAASVPAAGFATANCVPDDKPCNFWYFYNEHENATKVRQQLIADIARAITERGGEYRVSTFPDKGHNVWDKTWREEAVWDWVFSKTADGQPVTLLPGATKPVLFLQGAVCTAAKPGRNAGASPKRAADGLNATCYVSATPVTQGDWWRVDFATPISGNIAVKSGYSDGKGRVTAASVETSTDGASWTPCGQFSPADGACRFETEEPIKHLRVVSESPTGEILVLREVEVAP